MNAELQNGSAIEPKVVVLAQCVDSPRRVPRMEPCEFERLLLRAMEVLNARNLQAQLAAKNS